MQWTKCGWRWSSWCGRFTIEPSRVIPGRYDLWDSGARHKHVCKSPEIAKDVAQKLNKGGKR